VYSATLPASEVAGNWLFRNIFTLFVVAMLWCYGWFFGCPTFLNLGGS
jgi:hypothetical protein